MGSSLSPMNLPDNVGRGLNIAAGEAGKMPSEIVLEARDQFGGEHPVRTSFQKRSTSFAVNVGPNLLINSGLYIWTSCRARYLRT